MTKTEQYQGAWSVLKSEQDIYKMMDECECQDDELILVIRRLERVRQKRADQAEKEKMNAIVQQMSIAGITHEKLKAFIDKQPKPKKPKKPKIHIATIEGVKVIKGEPLPPEMKKNGWTRISQIPDEYLTEQGKAELER